MIVKKWLILVGVTHNKVSHQHTYEFLYRRMYTVDCVRRTITTAGT